MKKIILLLCFLTVMTVNAQFSRKHFLFQNSGISIGNYYGGNTGLNYIYNEKYSLELGFSYHVRKAKLQPDDYIPGFEALFFILTAPRDDIISYKLLVGKIKSLNKSGTLRLNLKGGFAYSNVMKTINWTPKGTVGRYTYDYDRNDVISVIISPEINFIPLIFFGFSLSPFVLVNSKTIAFGIKFNTMFGIVG